MARLDKITSLSDEELQDLLIKKTDWWFIAKESKARMLANPKEGFWIWLSEQLKVPDGAANSLKEKIKNLGGVDVSGWYFRGVNVGTKTKIAVIPR